MFRMTAKQNKRHQRGKQTQKEPKRTKTTNNNKTKQGPQSSLPVHEANGTGRAGIDEQGSSKVAKMGNARGDKRGDKETKWTVSKEARKHRTGREKPKAIETNEREQTTMEASKMKRISVSLCLSTGAIPFWSCSTHCARRAEIQCVRVIDLSCLS